MPSKPARLPSGKSAPELLDMYFLEARMHLLETAAFLDRLARARDVEMRGAADQPRTLPPEAVLGGRPREEHPPTAGREL